VDLINSNCALSIKNTEEFERAFTIFLKDEEKRLIAAKGCRDYVTSHTGATEKILNSCKAYL